MPIKIGGYWVEFSIGGVNSINGEYNHDVITMKILPNCASEKSLIIKFNSTELILFSELLRHVAVDVERIINDK